MIGWIFYNPVIDFILEPYCDSIADTARNDCALRVDEPLEGLSTRQQVARVEVEGSLPQADGPVRGGRSRRL